MRKYLRSPDEIAAWTQAFVRVPSPQTERMEAEPAVQGFISDCVMPLLDQVGFSGRRDPMGNVIVEIGPEGAEDGLLIVGYAMTHPASSMNEPYAGERVETAAGPAIRGRGAAEQKGALAAAIAAVEAVRNSGHLRRKVVFAVATAGETGRHDAIRSIISELGRVPPFGIVALGTGSRLSLGNKGRIDFDVVVRGKAVHSSTPWLGTDAIEGARHVLNRLVALDLSNRHHPDLGSASLTPTRIETGPNATHTVQNKVRITYDRRLLPGDQPDPALAEIEAVLAGIDERWPIEVRPGPYMVPCEIKSDGALMRHVVRGFESFGLTGPETFYSHGALDAGYLQQHGCEAVMWGPGAMEMFHTDEELVHIHELAESAIGYLAVMASVAGNGTGAI
jgi:acetylornithine deacetylase/succinyl-diaminopimelate desuccinylase-like protein